MQSQAGGAWTPERLEALARQVDPRASLVPTSLLRRLIRRGWRSRRSGFQVPHDDALALTPRQALEHASAAELKITTTAAADDRLLLLSIPPQAWLRTASDEEVVQTLWRRLLHLRVHDALDARAAAGIDMAERAARLERHAFEEVRSVLRADNRLIDPQADAPVYVEFAATFIELRYLAPELLPVTFPALADLDAIDRLLAEDLDAESLVQATRPRVAGVVSGFRPVADADPEAGANLESAPPSGIPPRSRATEWEFERMRQRAAHAAARGNDVRAAILQTRAARLATPARAGEAREAARESIVALSRRLQAALKWDEATRQRWAAALDPLRDFARQGFRSSAARALYDLQRVCIDFERPLYEINLIEWLLSFGRRSIKRPLPHQRQVRNVKHLRRALDRLARVPLPDSDRTALMELLQAELDRARLALRSAVLPLVARAVDRSDLRPRNLPEEVARRAIDEELVERIESSGYLAIGDVRDAIARNDLKLDDLTPREFVHGDALLCADRRLAVALGGIYRRAESYLRGLQKASSLAFGTAAGRVLTLWLVIPFGAALATLVTAEHLVEMAQEFLLPARAVALEEARWSAATAGADAVAVESVREHFMKGMMVHEIAPQWVTPGGIAILGLAILGLMHWPAFRAAVVRCLRGVGWGMRAVLWDLPRWAARWPALRRLFESHWFRFFGLWLLFPASVALLAMALPWLLGAPSAVTAGVGLGGFLCGALLANTPAGQRLLDEASDLSALGWRYVRIDLLPGLYQAIMGFFHTLLERIDRLLYVVDEWLRFRAGESRWSIGVKAVAGLVWSVVVYLVRMFVNLLAEPQINPIKHFPTVTVAHKMTAPFLLFMLPAALQAPPLGMSAVNANLVAFFAQLLLPGVFGFLVWELKENWRLYAANRPKALPAAIVGGHGETMRQLLRPGFHSGTLPRLFARLRRVDPTTRRRVRQGSSHQQLSALHHTEAAVAAFAWRQLIAVIEASQMLPGVRLRVGHVHLSTNQILIPLVRDEDPSDPLTISLEERAGWLLVTLHEAPGWLDVLSSPARAALGNAVAGFYQRCGAELVSEQVRAALAPSGAEFEVTARGLRAWLPGQVQSTVLFDLRDGNAISEAREVLGLPPTPQSPVLTVQRMLLKQNPIQWTRWVEVWDRARAGEPVPALAPFLFRRRSVAAADQRPRKIAAPAE